MESDRSTDATRAPGSHQLMPVVIILWLNQAKSSFPTPPIAISFAAADE
jgi:hypothetical protein